MIKTKNLSEVVVNFFNYIVDKMRITFKEPE